MIAGATYEQMLATRKHMLLPNGTGVWKSYYIRSTQETAPAPQAFLVEQGANEVVLPHFHEQNQFQVVINGGGTVGRNAVAPITVHYAGAYTGYGPISSGDDGLWYLTLRPMMDNGPLYLHESRDKMKPGPKKHYQSETIGATPEGSLAKLAQPEAQTINADPQGPTVELFRVPPQQRQAVAGPDRGGGQFFFVTGGSLRSNGVEYPKWSCLWAGSGDPAFEIAAGASGVEVLLLEFPRIEYRATYSAALQIGL
ncbi:MAG: hypothetical protein EXR33_02365 [Betaproteobacteria bacterium]|nr:hypothetical protein [Betaproteobacteria bacterium]